MEVVLRQLKGQSEEVKGAVAARIKAVKGAVGCLWFEGN